MKKLTTISLIIFWAILTSLLLAGLLFYQKNNIACAPCPGISGNSTGDAQAGTRLDMNELAKHNSVKDCWLLISGKVYDVSSYLTAHPGGISTISPYCGKEASEAFQTKDIGRPHSNGANNLLGDYYIGDLNQTIGSQPATDGINNKPVVNDANNIPASGIDVEVTLDMKEIAKHNTTGDCWLLINNKIYNVSSYLSAHPGGASTISPYCGKEASSAFATKDKNKPHSTSANNLLSNYYIGDLNQKFVQQQIESKIKDTSLIVPQNGGEQELENENEFEDD
jgi:cytochrome b involved in lipid metabolism